MAELLSRIDKLDNRKAIRVLEFYSKRVFDGMETSHEEILNGIPAEFKDRVPVERWIHMSSKGRDRKLPETESAALVKALLYLRARCGTGAIAGGSTG